MTPDQQLRAALRSGNAEQIADLSELMQAESAPRPRRVVLHVNGVTHVDADFAAGLSADTQDMIDMTRRIWDEAKPIEY